MHEIHGTRGDVTGMFIIGSEGVDVAAEPDLDGERFVTNDELDVVTLAVILATHGLGHAVEEVVLQMVAGMLVGRGLCGAHLLVHGHVHVLAVAPQRQRAWDRHGRHLMTGGSQ